MDNSEQLVYIAQQYRGWKLSFDGDYYSGICQAVSWPPYLHPDRGPFKAYFQRQPNVTIPCISCTDFSLALVPEKNGEASSRLVALVHPERANDCLDEVLYGGLLHLALLPPGVDLSVALPKEYAAAVNPHHVNLLRQPDYIHPPKYRVGPNFRSFPHPLPVVPDEEMSPAVLIEALYLPEQRVTD